jgi:hypothetical protein
MLWDESDDRLKFPDGTKISLGTTEDLQIFHDGTSSFINESGSGGLRVGTSQLQVQNASFNENMILATADGAVTLYYDSAAKLATAATGVAATGDVTATGTVEPAGDTAAGDNAAIGYTAAEGLILTGQGSTSDITFKNDADATVMSIPTGTTNVGIGSANGLDKLHVFEEANSAIATQLLLQNQGGGNHAAGIAFQVTSSAEAASTVYAPKAAIIQERTTSYGRGPIKFIQDNAADANPFGAGDEVMRIDAAGNVGIGTSSPSEKLDVVGNVTISGSLSKGSGSFRIDHPVKSDTHHLVHSFVEAPTADNIYRGSVALVDGVAKIDLDTAARLTSGTFEALNTNVDCWVSNKTGWTSVRATVSGSTLSIEAQNKPCTDTVSWLVIGERHDQTMIDADWTDAHGRVITEPKKETK